MELEKRRQFLINTLYFFIIIGAIYIVSRFMLKYLTPFIIAFFVAWIVQKPAIYISDKFRFKNKIFVGIMAVLLFVVVITLIFLILFGIINTAAVFFTELSKKAPAFAEYFSFLKDKVESFFTNQPIEVRNLADSFINSIWNSMIKGATSFLTYVAGITVKKTPIIFISCIVSTVASYYIAVDFYRLLKFSRSLFGEKIYKNTLKVKRIFTDSILSYIKGYSLLLAITFTELCIGLLILRVKYAVFLALIISIVDILPVLGTGTVLLPWAITVFVTGNSKLCFGIIILYIVITIIRNFAEPKIIGKQVGINPLLTLIVMFVGAGISGLSGMVLFPVAFIIIIKYYREELQNEDVF